MTSVAQLRSTLELSGVYQAFQNLNHANNLSTHSFGYNSSYRYDSENMDDDNDDNGSAENQMRLNFGTLTPARWRLQICRLVDEVLRSGAVSVHDMMKLLQQHLNNEEYGFNQDIARLLIQHNADMNAIITFQGIRCTLLHAMVQIRGHIGMDQESFRTLLVRSKPLLDLKDDRGRTVLAIVVWKLSASNPSVHDVTMIHELTRYGFSPFVKFRGMTVMEKLTKIWAVMRKRKAENVSKKVPKGIQKFLKTYQKIKYFHRRVTAIDECLNELVKRRAIVDDVAEIIKDFIGVTHHVNVKHGGLKPKLSLKKRIEKLKK